MGKLIHIIVVLIGISLISGLVLGGIDGLTKERIKLNVLEFKKVPAVIAIYEGMAGALDETKKEELKQELLSSFTEIEMPGEDDPLTVFIVKKDGKPVMAAIDRDGEGGYGGMVGVMVGFNLETGDLDGIGITTDSETPGLGKKVHEEVFRKQFKGMKSASVFKIKKDGGPIDAVSGASKSSRAVADGVDRAVKLYQSKASEIKSAADGQPAPSGEGS
jgi:electron transport complex protein RnfG